ncbi:MAG TPA: hydroxysqualene dehydroxylase HpnE [Rhizomicrobium sp.]|jgi:squalene-associated FAD-dependent desaturase|nr:hydroxysqualene dehydroxylase HpnE [Rhizomicrobium sp.]
MSSGTVYVVGAGISGLAAGVALASRGARVVLIEGAGQAGGRCRSYVDPVLNQTIDNGNHLILSGNHATFAYLRTIGSADRLAGPERACFAFVDVRSGARWTVSPNEGTIPWWVFSDSRRVPGTSLGEYLTIAKLLGASSSRRIGEVIRCDGALWERLLRPLLLAALNTEPEAACAGLAAAVLRETLMKGGRAYRPRIASPHLGSTFIDPALDYLKKKGAEVRFGSRLRHVEVAGKRATMLEVADGSITLGDNDRVVLATPAWVTGDLLPDVVAPTEFRSIVNAHFAIARPANAPLMIGLIGGVAEWVFAFPDRVSVTVSGADAIVDRDREDLARTLWRDVAAAHGLGPELPAWQIVKERRATFAATPEQAKRRPKAETRWSNLFLAGDWTDTALPATIEGAVRSGNRAAELALRPLAR